MRLICSMWSDFLLCLLLLHCSCFGGDLICPVAYLVSALGLEVAKRGRGTLISFCACLFFDHVHSPCQLNKESSSTTISIDIFLFLLAATFARSTIYRQYLCRTQTNVSIASPIDTVCTACLVPPQRDKYGSLFFVSLVSEESS